MTDQDRIKLEAELSEAKALPGPVQAYQEIDRLRADLAVARERVRQIEAALPSTYYSDRDPATRVRFMVEQWQRAVTANQQLEAEVDEAKAIEARLEAMLQNSIAREWPNPTALRDLLGPVVELLTMLEQREHSRDGASHLWKLIDIQLTRLRAVMGKEKL